MTGQVHELSLTINGLNANANVLRSINVTVGSLFGIVRTNRDSELYVSSSAVNGGGSSELTSQQVIVNAC